MKEKIKALVKPKLPRGDDHYTTQELIGLIERKDRIFRFSQSLFMILVLVALLSVITAQFRTLEAVRTQVDEQSKIVGEIQKNNDEALDKVNRRLNCLAIYFSQKDRTQITIQNIDSCVLNKDGSNQQFDNSAGTSPGGQTPNLSPSTTEPATGSATTPSQSNTGSTNNNQSDTGGQSEQRPPVTLQTPFLDIPLCLPATGLCIR